MFQQVGDVDLLKPLGKEQKNRKILDLYTFEGPLG